MGVFGTAVTHHVVRYMYRGARAAVPKTQALVHLCSSDAVCGEKNHRTVGAFGTILGLFSPPPQETRSQTRPIYGVIMHVINSKIHGTIHYGHDIVLS